MTEFHFRDVRMRGFQKRVPLDEVLDWLEPKSARLEGESALIDHATGRVLANAIQATRDVPPFRRSAMDGYALRGEETTGAGDYSPLTFEIVGESWPGRRCSVAVESGQAIRIMTGAPVPDGADAVIPAEQASDDLRSVQITASIPPGKNVGEIGEDMRAGTEVLPAGRVLRPQDIGILAALGLQKVPLVRRPRVRLLITGNELARGGREAGPFEIYDSNSWMLRALVYRDGGSIESIVTAPDHPLPIEQTLTKPGADVLLVSGGSSVGREDHAPSVLAAVGEVHFHGIAIRPASPAGVGVVGETLVFLLPGNPVSCLCAYDLMAGGVIRGMGGRSRTLPYPARQLPLGRKIVSAVGRLDYCRVAIENETVVPLSISGASVLSSTCRADGFVLVPPEREGYPAGTTVDVFLFDLPPHYLP